MPFDFTLDTQQLSGGLVAVISLVAAMLTAIWIALIIWTYRDMRSRSRDVFATLLATLVVALLNVPGLIVYLILRPRLTLSEQYERTLEEEALLQAIEERQVCPGCGHISEADWRLCPFCHTRLRKPCVRCDKLLELPWKICPYCEQPQSEEAGNPRRNRAERSPASYLTDPGAFDVRAENEPRTGLQDADDY